MKNTSYNRLITGLTKFGPNQLVTMINQFWAVICGSVRLFWVWIKTLTSLSLG